MKVTLYTQNKSNWSWCNILIYPVIVFLLLTLMIVLFSCSKEEDIFNISAVPGHYICEPLHLLIEGSEPGTRTDAGVMQSIINIYVQETGDDLYNVYVDSFSIASNPDSFIVLPVFTIELLEAGAGEYYLPFVIHKNGYFESTYNRYSTSHAGVYTEEPHFRYSYPFGYYISFLIENTDPDNEYSLAIAGKKQEAYGDTK